MTAIHVKYISPTNHKPARWVAETMNEKPTRIYRSINHPDIRKKGDIVDEQWNMAFLLIQELDWPMKRWYRGDTKQGSVFVLEQKCS